jgi:pantoate--beta-alanine ligase
MHIINTITDLHTARTALRGRIALVPTMGNLHAGHLSLVEKARASADHVIVTIFVNPLQFGPQEDFNAYPRTLAQDCAQLERTQTDIVFAPSVHELYPQGMNHITRVLVPQLSDILCGAVRAGHFSGVATIVLRLFNLIRADCAIFGEKDFQQLLIIRRMVADLFVPIEIIGMPTQRDNDGLALSSRNQYLSSAERRVAPTLYYVLNVIKERLEADPTCDIPLLETWAAQQLCEVGFNMPDYITIRDAHTLDTPHAAQPDWVVLAAARLGAARLIDNQRIHIPHAAA